MGDRHERQHKKGDDKAGGGGGRGGGGKRTRPPESWEKGDVARQVRAARPEAHIPRKPGRAETPEEAVIADHGSGEAPYDPPILRSLRRINAKLLAALRRLGATARADQRLERLRSVETHLASKRRLEARLVPLLDGPEVAETLEELGDLDRDIDRQVAKLDASSPSDPGFTMGVRVLHGEVELQIRREREQLIPTWTAMGRHGEL